MVEIFQDHHYLELCKWWDEHGLPVVDRDDLPKFGVIVPGLAAGFMVCTDTPMAMLDFFISNKSSCPIARSKALDDVVQALIIAGKDSGFRVFKADSKIQAIIDRGIRLGFRNLGSYESIIFGGD